MEALARELGPVGTIRFLQLFENGVGDYTKERQSAKNEAQKNAQAADKGKMTTNA